MSLIFRCGAFQFAGATQLLPQGLSKEQSESALKAFAGAMDGKIPEQGNHKLPQGSFAWQEYRVATKTLLMGIANGLRMAMPSGWNLSNCCPSNVLIPRSINTDRLPMLKEEKMMHGLDPDMEYFTCYNFASHARWGDYYNSEDHYKLCFAADEGTEARKMLGNKNWAYLLPYLKMDQLYIRLESVCNLIMSCQDQSKTTQTPSTQILFCP